ncbi:LLM class flavin-dependent oxidoreductase [Patulibacter minatonensis]|uniref:LLM class flavin-dependent oxidoreductase n=1 Tax=Patulibacter minatonensis TaxID=298163 RepID=UPI00047D6FB7|nr:LLM class flavin-dependent oxidoreductase [Patulibacter minatonensis]
MTTTAPGIGMTVFNEPLKHRTAEDRRTVLRSIGESGIDHIHLGDHVSFRNGTGWDGLITATSMLHMQDLVPVHLGVYQPVLRHPVLVARELSTLTELAPGRLVLGVGVGGDDPAEVRMCGVNPKTRGRRMDEHLPILRALLHGERVTHDGEFFQLDDVFLTPTPDPEIPILIGGRSDKAIQRTGRLGDGWQGIWVSADRFAQTVEQVEQAGADAGRTDVPWRHQMIVWCGLGDDRVKVREVVAHEMHAIYGIDYERFEKWSPAGTPEDLAEFLAPYAERGCSDFSLIAHGGELEETIEHVAAVKRLLSGVTVA